MSTISWHWLEVCLGREVDEGLDDKNAMLERLGGSTFGGV